MEKVKRFLDALRLNPKAQQMARSFRIPESEEEAAKGYLRLAREMGFDMDEEEMKAGLQEMVAAAREKSSGVESEIGKIREEELDGIAGGSPGAWYPSYCKSSFEEGQWCWYADSCSGAINNYQGVIEEFRD